ncbi:HNH endonuclease [Parabacteroides sp. Marseille-P3160]|uniref:HNH endonuclease n=1 Tax=Parabacteroides sp. Marseille-P3160 TaxID=1917887 RepID=UPI001F3C0D75|nr:HNH endonuclease [Parabacteroides sp. Marseille-P3160]
MCLKEGRTTAAEEVHHIVSFMETTNQDVRIQLAFDDENLMSVCKVCHQKMHNSK